MTNCERAANERWRLKNKEKINFKLRTKYATDLKYRKRMKTAHKNFYKSDRGKQLNIHNVRLYRAAHRLELLDQRRQQRVDDPKPFTKPATMKRAGEYFNYIKRTTIDPDAIFTEAYEKDRLKDALTTLNERERSVIEMRYGFNQQRYTLREVGNKIGVSPEYVRSLEARALNSLRCIYVNN